MSKAVIRSAPQLRDEFLHFQVKEDLKVYIEQVLEIISLEYAI